MSLDRQSICASQELSNGDTKEEPNCTEQTCDNVLDNSSDDTPLKSFDEECSSESKKSDIALDRSSYVCAHQGPTIVSSSTEAESSENSENCTLLVKETSSIPRKDLDVSEGECLQHDTLLTSPGSSASYNRLNENSGIMCRICHCGEEEESLMITCRCMGTVKYAHQNCVLNWISKSGNQYCELCKYKFKTRRKKIKSLWKWQFPSVSTKGWLHIGLFIAFVTMLLTSITWIVWSRVSSTPTAVAERTTDEVKFAYMLNGLFIALAIGGLYFDSYRHVKRYFQRWSVLNRHMIIEPYCKPNLTCTGGDEKDEGSASLRPLSPTSCAVEITENQETSADKKSFKSRKGTWV